MNRISSVNNSTFIPLRKLTTLDMSFNALTKLEAGLISLVSLRKVWFNNNNISEVDPEIVGKTNIELIFFNMDNNSLTYFDPWPYTTYQTYQRRFDREFFFRHNKIERITNYMNWTYDLRYPFEVIVNLQYNKIKEISTEVLQQFDPEINKESTLAAFFSLYANLSNNPFFCDCTLYSFASAIQSSVFHYFKVEDYRYRCGSPASVLGEDFLHDLPLDNLVCNITTDCPAGCHCQDRPHNDTLFVNCTGAGLTEMPDVIPDNNRSKLELFFDNNYIAALKNTSYIRKIHNISLFSNRIESLDADILKSLNATHLDFRNNRIVSLPREIRKFSYSTVQLAGNPLECNCESVWLLDWMTLDSDRGDTTLTCDSKTGTHRILDINLKVLGCTNELIVIICVCLGVVLALLVVALIFAKRCPYETRVILYKLFRLRVRDKYEFKEDQSKEVDIYMVFDHHCEDVIGWVRYFLKKLNRKKPIYSILNPMRFMEPGSEAVSIPKWIGRSKRIIIVLSDKIFENEWRCFEIEDAERRIIESATSQNKQSTDDSSEHDENVLNDISNKEQHGDCAINMGDENLENAPKIIYIVFNSSDLLKTKLLEDEWIERIGARQTLRKNNPNDYDERAKEWQEKLQQEPWKSRLAGKAVLSPDDRMFWSKLRYELPRKGNGVGDGNFTFGRQRVNPIIHPHCQANGVKLQETREGKVNGQDSLISPKFFVSPEKAGVHKNYKCSANGYSDPCKNAINKNIRVCTISKNKDNLKHDRGKKKVTIMDKPNNLLNVLQKIKNTDTNSKADVGSKQMSNNVNGGLKSVLLNALSTNDKAEGQTLSGTAEGRIFTIGTRADNSKNSSLNPLDFSRTMRSDTISNISLSSSSSS